LILLIGPIVAEPQENPDASLQQQRYESFAAAAGRYKMWLENDRKNEKAILLKLIDKPVLRWGNQARDNDVGAVFVWTREGRPQAVAAIFVIGDRTMHELCSLAESPLTSAWGESSPAWCPTKPGVTFRTIPGPSAPADTRPARLAQMRKIANEFTATTSAPADYGGGRSHGELRLLPQPLYRNPDESELALDGALFTFAFGTDPEVLLLVEARKMPEGYVWHYAAAPFTDFAIQLKHKDQPVWTEPLAQESRLPMVQRTHAGIWQDDLEGGKTQP
jgi:hypothetical protein